MDFAIALDQNLKTVFSDFDQQSISKSPHLEKLCLIKDNIGKDNISDFTTNLIKGFLLGYTQTFALSHIAPELRREIRVERAQFNYTTQTWVTKTYTLPFILNNYVLLAPRDILTKDENWINKKDLTRDFQAIVDSVSDAEVRSLLNNYFLQNLPPPQKTKKDRDKQPSQEDIAKAVFNTIEKYPYILDYFLKHKEETGDQAQDISKARVAEVYSLFVEEVSVIIAKLSEETEFYETPKDTLESAYQRVLFLKNVVENKDGYRVFYKDGNPIKREADVHVMYRLTWYAAPEAVSREANEGRGPVDFVVSNGAKDKSLVEFKLASNSKLKQNLESQVEIYQRAHDTDKKIKVILFFSEEEAIKTHNILKEIKLENEKYIVMIDARNDNKPSASNAKKISEE